MFCCVQEQLESEWEEAPGVPLLCLSQLNVFFPHLHMKTADLNWNLNIAICLCQAVFKVACVEAAQKISAGGRSGEHVRGDKMRREWRTGYFWMLADESSIWYDRNSSGLMRWHRRPQKNMFPLSVNIQFNHNWTLTVTFIMSSVQQIKNIPKS